MSPSSKLNPPGCLRGVIAPLLTPCHPDGRLDLDGAAAEVSWLADRGCVSAVFARSGMGRWSTFTVDETKQFAESTHRAAAGKMGFLLGAAGEWLDRDSGGRPDSGRYVEQAIELTGFARDLGADAAVHPIPEALAPADGEAPSDVVFGYYQAIDQSAGIPLVIYQPGGTSQAYRLTPELLRRLAALPHVAGAKISTDDDAVFAPLAESVRGEPFALICGHEGYYLKGLGHGAVGVIGQGSVGYPAILDSLGKYYAEGHLSLAKRAQMHVHRALEAAEGLAGATALKQYLIRKGVAMQPYGRGEPAPYPDEIIDKLTSALDSLMEAYRFRWSGGKREDIPLGGFAPEGDKRD